MISCKEWGERVKQYFTWMSWADVQTSMCSSHATQSRDVLMFPLAAKYYPSLCIHMCTDIHTGLFFFSFSQPSINLFFSQLLLILSPSYVHSNWSLSLFCPGEAEE